MSLEPMAGVTAVRVDLDDRTVTVSHEAETSAIAEALEALGLEATQVAGAEEPVQPLAGDGVAMERRVFAIALLINAGFFVAELAAGLIGRSMGLVADSLDMFADASVYGLSLLAVGGPISRKKRLAAGSGYLQLGLAIVGLVEVIRRLVADEALPDVRLMIIVSALALVGNLATLLVLRRARSTEAHFQASWIFTSNDIKVNALVIVAAVVVSITNNGAADLLAGAAIFIIVANGARRILVLAR